MLEKMPAVPTRSIGEMPGDLPDSEVIRRSLDEPELFALLFRRHAPALGCYVCRRLGPDHADDIVAETFLAAFRQRAAADLAEARLTADAASRAVAAALASLRPEHRDVVLLVTWAELTYDQVAHALGIPEGTVRSRMSRARARLRGALASTPQA